MVSFFSVVDKSHSHSPTQGLGKPSLVRSKLLLNTGGLRISGVETPPAARTNLGRVRKRPPGRKILRAEILKVHGGKYPSRAPLWGETRVQSSQSRSRIPRKGHASRSYRGPHPAASFRRRSICVQCKECLRVLIATCHLVASDGIEPPTPCAASGCPCPS